jgi:histone H3/H4
MYKLVKELVPQVRLSGEAKDLIVTACNEFIHLLASEANTVCEKQSKKLILPDHVLLALDNLGFGEYKQDCIEVMKQMQEEVDKRKKLRNKLEKPGIPEEELLRQQNQLFAEARKQQQLIENAEEWSKVQHEAQIALQRQASCSNNSNLNSNNYSHSSNGNSANSLFNQTSISNINNNSSSTTINGNNFPIYTTTATSKNKNLIDDDDDNYD